MKKFWGVHFWVVMMFFSFWGTKTAVAGDIVDVVVEAVKKMNWIQRTNCAQEGKQWVYLVDQGKWKCCSLGEACSDCKTDQLFFAEKERCCYQDEPRCICDAQGRSVGDDGKCECEKDEILVHNTCCLKGDEMCRCKALGGSDQACECVVESQKPWGRTILECKCEQQKKVWINGTCCDQYNKTCRCEAAGKKLINGTCCPVENESEAECRCRAEDKNWIPIGENGDGHCCEKDEGLLYTDEKRMCCKKKDGADKCKCAFEDKQWFPKPAPGGCCEKDEVWNGKECIKACPIGSVYCDDETGECSAA